MALNRHFFPDWPYTGYERPSASPAGTDTFTAPRSIKLQDIPGQLPNLHMGLRRRGSQVQEQSQDNPASSLDT
jgi:hypothetical protein